MLSVVAFGTNRYTIVHAKIGEIMRLVILFCFIGMLSGILNGLTSIGGSLLASFSLIIGPPLLGDVPLSMVAVGAYTAGVSLASAGSSFLLHWRRHRISIKNVLVLGIPALLGSVAGTRLAFGLSNAVLRFTLTVALIATMGFFLRPLHRTEHQSWWHVPFSILLGLLIGVFGGVLGVGAGFLFLPVYVGIVGYPIREAIIYSLGAGILITVTSLLMRSVTLTLPWGELAGLMICSVGGAQIGVIANSRSSERSLKRVILTVLLAITIDMIIKIIMLWK